MNTHSTSDSPGEVAAPTTRSARVLASLARDGGLWLYGAATLLGAPHFLRRKWRLQKNSQVICEFDPSRWRLRFPDELDAQPKNPTAAPGPRVMIFAQGWGEVETMKPLIAALRAARPDARLLFTTRHREGIAPAAKLSDEEVSPFPFDHSWPVARWLEKTRPDVVIFYEQFFYGTLLRALWLRGVPFVVVHARNKPLAASSAFDLALKKWQLRGLRAICLSSPDRVPFMRQVSPADGQIHVMGSIKFPHQKPRLAPEREADLHQWIEAGARGTPILAAGSTRETEEAFVLDALEAVRRDATGPMPVLLLAPRKITRTPEIVELLRARGLKFSQRSQGQSAEAVEVLLLDTLGELATAYQWAQAAFVGGTVFGASHNVAEPLVWSIPVAYGPKRGNFETEQLLCEGAGVGFRVHTPDELAAHWIALLESPALRAELAVKVDALVAEQSRAFERTLQILIDAVDAVSTHQ